MHNQDIINQCISCQSEDLEPFITTRAQMHHDDETFTFVRCEKCGLVMLNPRVDQGSLQKYYSDYYLPFRGPSAWGKYEPLVAKNLGKTDRKRVKLSQKVIDFSKETRVLDVGCGKPTFLDLLQKQTGAYCKGIDFSDEGWKNTPDSFRNIDLEVAEFHEFSTDKPFDLITMWHYLEHDYQPKETLRRMKEVAHEDSRMLIEVPNFDSWTRKVQKAHWEGYHTPRHTAVYSPETITTLLENSGWKVESVKPYGTLDPYPLFWMGRQEKRGIDWSQSMEKKFVGFVAGMILTAPIFMLKKWLPAGIMTIVAQPDQ